MEAGNGVNLKYGKEITIDDFRPVSKNKPLVAKCWSYEDTNDANAMIVYDIHKITDLLIKEAGKYCNCYATDVLCDIENIVRMIRDGVDAKTLIGFREMGVDGDASVLVKINDPLVYGEDVYKAIYMFEVKVLDGSTQRVEVKLRKVSCTK